MLPGMRAMVVATLLMGTAFGDSCALPELALPTSADADLSRTMEVLGLLVVASKNDAARAASDPSSLGLELASLSGDNPRPIAAGILPLLSQLRRLDCAALDGRLPPPQAFAALTDEAGKWISKLSNAPTEVAAPPPRPMVLPPPPPPLPPPLFAPPPPRPIAVDRSRSARSLLRVAYAFFGVSAGLMVIATGVTIDGSINGCDGCFLDFHPLEVGVGVATFIIGGLALVGATSFMIAGHSELRKLRLAPSASLDRNGGVLGLRGSF